MKKEICLFHNTLNLHHLQMARLTSPGLYLDQVMTNLWIQGFDVAKFGPKYPRFVVAARIFGSKFASRDNQRSSIPWNSLQMIDHCPRYRWVWAAKTLFQRNLFQSEHTNCLSPHVDISIYSIADSDLNQFHVKYKISQNISSYLYNMCMLMLGVQCRYICLYNLIMLDTTLIELL